VKDFDSPYSGSGYSTPAKKRRLSRRSPTPGSNDSDFVEDESEADEEIPAAEIMIEDDDLGSPVNAARSRAAARK
jgi:hypothetical protein